MQTTRGTDIRNLFNRLPRMVLAEFIYPSIKKFDTRVTDRSENLLRNKIVSRTLCFTVISPLNDTYTLKIINFLLIKRMI